MQTYSNKHRESVAACFLHYLTAIALFIVSGSCFADNVVITGNTIINKPTTYDHVVLDMNNGRFTINHGGSLNIENSTIKATVSSSNPFLFHLKNGSLVLNNNKLNAATGSIAQDANHKSAYHMIEVQQGVVRIDSNNFSVDTPNTVSFLDTSFLFTFGTKITSNSIKNFHGGIYLTNANNVDIESNRFENVSFSNIFSNGHATKINSNTFSFPGNLVLGDAIDVLNSSDVTITENIIASSAGYGISIMGGQNVYIENNKISDGLSYAISIVTPCINELNKTKYLNQLVATNHIKWLDNKNIVVYNNYLAQNRYGLAGEIIDHMIVTKNIFIQRFVDNSARQYWTNNDILLPTVNDLTWMDNLYKEAFTQEVPGDNTNTLQFVPFPKHGGVILP